MTEYPVRVRTPPTQVKQRLEEALRVQRGFLQSTDAGESTKDWARYWESLLTATQELIEGYERAHEQFLPAAHLLMARWREEMDQEDFEAQLVAWAEGMIGWFDTRDDLTK